MRPLPRQARDVPWPTKEWARRALGPDVDRARLEAALDRGFASGPDGATGLTHALVVISRGALVVERYGAEGGPDVPLPSWSMAKSMLQAAIGIAVRNGMLDVAAPPGVPEWRA